MIGIIGDLVEDTVVWLSGPIEHGTDTESRIFHTRGGSGANVATSAARFGATRFIGCVGADARGDALVATLEADGVDVRVNRHGSTGTIVILIDAEGERTMLPDRGASVLLDEVPDAWLNDLRLLHVPAYAFHGEPTGITTADAIRRARSFGARISVDASSTGMLARYGARRFLDLMAELRPDVLLANAEEAACLGLWWSGAPGPDRVALPDTIVVVKHGADPTWVDAPGADPFAIPVPPVREVRDLTGAGDAFAAGFLSTYMETDDLTKACATGHAAAARVLTSPGSAPL
ncbi:carbohydrate kinase family protein [Yinghuangia seranimata]|uniref:carbohydrate kinase family protein n=1 Tax=Yinghuangia seranimata TaxID=408067 RepID=UPI00248C2250|nr:PfkB family carbohydrate kinase [Yinghuangia seranimata]MDI2124521.1 PfkB family carbohydrate kinase [Yinghuangia seranimata]